MSVIDSDLAAKTWDQLNDLERYYLTIQRQRALTNVEAERLNALIREMHVRHTAQRLFEDITAL